MKFYKLLKHDLIYSIIQQYKKYIMVSIVIFLFCIDLFLKISMVYGKDVIRPTGTFSDYLLYIFKGVRKYVPNSKTPFQFPVVWMILHLLIAYITLYYPFKDLDSFGQNILVRTGTRVSWWMAKCVWNILSVLLYYLTVYGSIALFCVIFKVSMSYKISPEFLVNIMEFNQPFKVSNKEIMIAIYLLPILISLDFCLMQMTLTLFIRPLFSFFITAAMLLSSAYYLSPFLLGNYAMVVRNDVVIEDGINSLVGIAASLILIVLSVCIGCIYFKSYDVIRRE